MNKTERLYQLRGDKMIDTFGIRKVASCQELQEWLLPTNDTLTTIEDAILDRALGRYERLGYGWNEEELKMHFISSIFDVADTNQDGICKTFFERPLDGIIENFELHVIADCMIARPKLGGGPDKPYFFLQEFKQSQRFGRTDPEGQMLAAMLLAQQQNADEKHLYGCYVIERNWFFTTLKNRTYCVSEQYNASKKADLLQIVFILRKLKELIV